jgi:hypothetical protein
MYISIRRGLVVRISAFHAGGPGSIPGVGMLFLFYLRNSFFYIFLQQNRQTLANAILLTLVRSDLVVRISLFYAGDSDLMPWYRNYFYFCSNQEILFSYVYNRKDKQCEHYIIIQVRRGLVVRISAFHAGGPGSIPGVGMIFFWFWNKNEQCINQDKFFQNKSLKHVYFHSIYAKVYI